jgi:hypothetical protein
MLCILDVFVEVADLRKVGAAKTAAERLEALVRVKVEQVLVHLLEQKRQNEERSESNVATEPNFFICGRNVFFHKILIL